MKNSVIRELASMSVSGAAGSEDAQKFALESLPKRYLKKFRLYLTEEINSRRVTVKAAHMPDESAKKAFSDIFHNKHIHYETDPSLGAGIELEHNDNKASINIRNILERAIHAIKESL